MNKNHSVNDLLKLIGKDSSESEPFDSKLGKFINQFNLEKGVDKVKTSVIWYTYKEVFKGEMSKIGFFREFNKYFDQVRTGKQRFYKVTGSFDTSREGLIRSEHFNKG